MEFLAGMARAVGQSDAPAENVALAGPKDPAVPKARKSRPKDEGPSPEKSGAQAEESGPKGKKPGNGEATKVSPREKTGEEGLPVAESKPTPRPSSLAVSGGYLRVYSLRHEGVELTVNGIACDLPLRGAEADGQIGLGEISWGERVLVGPLRRVVRWSGGTLDFKETFRTEGGVELSVAARVRPGRRPAMDFLAQVQSSSLPVTEIPGLKGSQFGVETIRKAYLRGGGALASPGSWQGGLVLDAGGILIGHEGWGGVQRFDYGQMVAAVRGGILSIPDARLRSERLSLMGNGVVLSDGRQWSVVRVVADDELSRVVRRVMIGSNLSQGWTSSWMQPLVTPDRRFRDIHVKGTLPEVSVDLGRKREWIGVGDAVAVLRSFLERERLESRRSADTGKEGG